MEIIVITVGLTLLAEESIRWVTHRIARALRHRRRAKRIASPEYRAARWTDIQRQIEEG